jgi:hypothetical protein
MGVLRRCVVGGAGHVGDAMSPHEKRAKELVRQFGYRSDCELSLADIQWLGKEIAAALERAAQPVWTTDKPMVAGCEAKPSEYQWACYTFQDTSATTRYIIEYPCKVRHERKSVGEWVEVRP